MNMLWYTVINVGEILVYVPRKYWKMKCLGTFSDSLNGMWCIKKLEFGRCTPEMIKNEMSGYVSYKLKQYATWIEAEIVAMYPKKQAILYSGVHFYLPQSIWCKKNCIEWWNVPRHTKTSYFWGIFMLDIIRQGIKKSLQLQYKKL